MGCLATIGMVSILVVSQGPPAVAGRPESMGATSSRGGPEEVAIGFYIQDFARITVREESFDATAYLELSWREPRPSHGATKARTPRVYFENALEQPRYHIDPEIETDGHGLVTSWAVLSGKFSSPMDLRQFPFDRQVLSVRIGAFEDESIVKFVPKRELELVGDEAFVSEWTIDRPSARVESHRHVPGQATFSRYVYQVHVERRATFYVWRVMVPLSLLVAVSWAAFWFEPVGLQPQISTCMACLIALVAFNFAIDFSLPKVAYLTLIDRHSLIGFGFVAAAVVVVTLVHLAVTAGRSTLARGIQRAARWAFPPAYLLAVVWNVYPVLARWTS